MSALGFGSKVIIVDDAGMDMAVSEDGQAFTARFSALEAMAEGVKAPMATRVASFVLPLEGTANGEKIALRVQGHALVNEGASGLLIMTANGQVMTQPMPAGMDDSFLHELRIDPAYASSCRISMFLLAEFEPATDSAVRVGVAALDGELSREAGAKGR